MSSTYDGLVKAARWLGGALIIALVAVLFVNIVSREVLVLALPWANEVAVALFVWTGFVGAGVCFADNVRIRFEFLIDVLPRGARHAVELLVHYVGLALLIGLFVTSVYVAWVYRNQTFTTMPVSVVWQLAAVPVGTLLCIAGFVRHGTWRLRPPPADAPA
jgi:TRAP-type C4-dicarboxylate transport system permease small subunit